MARCTDSSISTAAACTGSFTLTAQLCGYAPTVAAEATCRAAGAAGASFPRLWTTFSTQTAYAGESFDSLGRALLVVFELVTGENWPVIMFNAVDGIGDNGGAVVENSNPSAAVYFVLSQIFINSVRGGEGRGG